MILLVWNEKYKNVIIKGIIIIASILIVNIIYYDNFSMRIEPLIYLHNKYNFDYSNMDIIETYKSSSGVLGESPGESRGAIIKYNKYNIYVYYEDGWKDNYNDVVSVEKDNQENIKVFNSILEQYTHDFKIIENPLLEYGYIIYLNTYDENIVDNIIQKLDNYVAKNDDNYIYYGLCILKNSDFYTQLINSDISKLKTGDTVIYGQIYATDLFKILGYSSERITSSNKYDKNIFINNGDQKDNEYKNPLNFKYIAFWYSAEHNSFSGQNTPIFQVFGIN